MLHIRRFMMVLAVASMMVAPHAAWANQQSDMCTLQAAKGTRSRLATEVLARTCWKVYENGSLMMNTERAYYGCLLDSLPGTDNDAAAQQVMTICGHIQKTGGW